jgi:triacylglycerol lipase
MARSGRQVFIFAHGILGFVELGLPRLGLSIRYFRALPAALRGLPVEAHFPAVPPVGTIASRARALAGYIEALDVPAVHLVGHSMGGLDCRLLAAQLDPERRVRSLTTLATPHRGTPLAEWIIEGRGLVPAVARRLLGAGIHELTPAACGRFNRAVADRRDVRYTSYAGARPLDEMPPWYRPWTRRIAARAGDNDSQVPVASAQWGEFAGLLRADHLELVGWSLARASRINGRPFDHAGLYREIVDRVIYSR